MWTKFSRWLVQSSLCSKLSVRDHLVRVERFLQVPLELLLQVLDEVRVKVHILVEQFRSVPSLDVSASSATVVACARSASGDCHDRESLRRHKNSGKVDTMVAQHPCAPQIPCCAISSSIGG